MTARNFDRAKRREQRAAVAHEKWLVAGDPSGLVAVDEDPDIRPVCLVCTRRVTEDGDEAKQLSSGSWVHLSCVELAVEAIETVSEETEGPLFEVEVEYSRYVKYRVRAANAEEAFRAIGTVQPLEDEISDVSRVATEIDE